MARRDSHGLTERGRGWQGLIDQCRHSGMTQKAFCREHHLNLGTFAWWKRHLRRQPSQRPHIRATAVGQTSARLHTTFAAVRLRPDTPIDRHARIDILLSGRRRIRLIGPVDRQQLTDVLAVLEGQAC